jgi:two-component system, response regulator PdtaR
MTIYSSGCDVGRAGDSGILWRSSAQWKTITLGKEPFDPSRVVYDHLNGFSLRGSSMIFEAKQADAWRGTILVIEDEPILRGATADFLRSHHYRVFEAGTAVEGAEVLRASGNVDAVFADINLPGVMGGLSFAVWMHERHPDIPVLLTSGVKLADTASRGVGRVPFVPKPYNLDQVVTLIEETISGQRNSASGSGGNNRA